MEEIKPFIYIGLGLLFLISANNSDELRSFRKTNNPIYTKNRKLSFLKEMIWRLIFVITLIVGSWLIFIKTLCWI